MRQLTARGKSYYSINEVKETQVTLKDAEWVVGAFLVGFQSDRQALWLGGYTMIPRLLIP